MKGRCLALTIFGLCLSFLLCACAGMQTKPSQANFEPPSLSLESFQVTQYDGYWYYAASVEPTKGEAGNHGAPLPMNFLFAVDNPNPYPVTLSGYRFTVALEDFELITVNSSDEYVIPAETTDHVSASTLVTTRSALLSLLVTGGFKLKEKGWSPWDALERWWTKVPTYEVPVQVKDGSATFEADGVTEVVPFSMTFALE